MKGIGAPPPWSQLVRITPFGCWTSVHTTIIRHHRDPMAMARAFFPELILRPLNAGGRCESQQLHLIRPPILLWR